MTKIKKQKDKEDDFYCKKCGGCGYIGCCGIRLFLKKHVEGKTDCPSEHSYIQEIIDFVEDHETFRLNYPDGDSTRMKKDYTIITYKNVKGKIIKINERNIGTKKKSKKKNEKQK